MKLIGKLKKQVEDANNKEEARKFISEAGMELTMDELEMVAGGIRDEVSDETRNDIERHLHAEQQIHFW